MRPRDPLPPNLHTTFISRWFWAKLVVILVVSQPIQARPVIYTGFGLTTGFPNRAVLMFMLVPRSVRLVIYSLNCKCRFLKGNVIPIYVKMSLYLSNYANLQIWWSITVYMNMYICKLLFIQVYCASFLTVVHLNLF